MKKIISTILAVVLVGGTFLGGVALAGADGNSTKVNVWNQIKKTIEDMQNQMNALSDRVSVIEHHYDNDDDNDDDHKADLQLKRVTYTVTDQDDNGDVVIPLFTTRWFSLTMKSDDLFNGNVVVEYQRADGSFDDVATIKSPDFHAFADNIRKRDSINTSDWADLSGGIRVEHPFQLRAVVVDSPAAGEVEIEIIFLAQDNNDDDNDDDDNDDNDNNDDHHDYHDD